MILIDFDAHGSGAKSVLNRKSRCFCRLTPFCATMRMIDFENWKKKFFFSDILNQKKKKYRYVFPLFFFLKLEKKRPVLPLRKFANPLPLLIGLTWDFPQRLKLVKSNQYTIFINFSRIYVSEAAGRLTISADFKLSS